MERQKPRLKWKLDVDRGVVGQCLERRGWEQTEGSDWNVYWANVGNLRAIFGPESGVRLADNQLINHFPNHVELSRKDLMVKNFKRYRKDMERQGLPREVLDFVPSTFSLPGDFALFAEEFRKSPGTMWIMKPTNRAQGKGIFIVNKMSQVKQWCTLALSSPVPQKESYIISKYIRHPLLIGGRKFDLRIYVLVTSYRPLMVYVYREGFARFSTAKYSTAVSDMDNPFVHLTNVAVQRHAESYNASHGGKWRLRNLRLYIESTRGKDAAENLFTAIESVILYSIRAVQHVMINDKHCFECYGYDIIVDEDLKPWLVEVNASPSLSFTTHTDKMLKLGLIRDILEIVVPENDIDTRSRRGTTASGPPKLRPTNGFEVLVDESLKGENRAAAENVRSSSQRRPSGQWR